MKRVIAMCLVVILAMGGIVCTAEAEKAIRTDITAEIDYTPIETYNVNGFTYVPVDILHNYGFEVEYKDGNTINVNRIRYATPMFIRELWEDSIREKTYADIITDDKKVYLDGNPANSVSTTDGVLMMIDELQKYGGFSWNEDKKDIEIRIFEKELIDDYNNAEGKVELTIDAAEVYHWNWTDTKATYIGQVDKEKKIPNGIGRYTYGGGTTRIDVLGYFKNGKPNGYIRRSMYRTVLKSYQNRTSFFCGYVDADKEIPIYEYSGNLCNNGNNFGAVKIPFRTIDEWTGPEMLDPNPYQNGIYYECMEDIRREYTYVFKSWRCNEEQISEENTYRIIWKEEEPIQVWFGLDNETIVDASEIYQYQNNQEVYYNGGIQTIANTMDKYGSRVLNNPSDGAGFYPFEIDIVLNGNKLLDYYDGKMAGDRVLVPCRGLFEEIGATVEWDEDEQKVTVTKGDKNIVLHIGSNIITVNNENIELDTQALLINERTYIPVRAVAEALDATVEWDEDLKDVIITL